MRELEFKSCSKKLRVDQKRLQVGWLEWASQKETFFTLWPTRQLNCIWFNWQFGDSEVQCAAAISKRIQVKFQDFWQIIESKRLIKDTNLSKNILDEYARQLKETRSKFILVDPETESLLKSTIDLVDWPVKLISFGQVDGAIQVQNLLDDDGAGLL